MENIVTGGILRLAFLTPGGKLPAWMGDGLACVEHAVHEQLAADWARLDTMVQDNPDAVFICEPRPGASLVGWLRRVRERRPRLPVILVTPAIDNELLADLFRLGLSGFVAVGNRLRLASIINDIRASSFDAVNEHDSLERVAQIQGRLLEKLATDSPLHDFLGEAARAMGELAPLTRVAFLLPDAWGKRWTTVIGPDLPPALSGALSASQPGVGFLASAWREHDELLVPDLLAASAGDPLSRAALDAEFSACLARTLRDRHGAPLALQIAFGRAQCAPAQSWGKAVEAVGKVATVALVRAAEDALVQRLSLAVEQSPSSIVITNTDGEIEYVNAAFSRVTGYTMEEVRGRNPRLLKSGHTPDEVYAELWGNLVAGKSWDGEFVNRRKNGELIIEREIFVPIRQDDGTVSHYLCVKEDVTEERRVVEELARHRDHLEELVSERTTELEKAKEDAEAATRAKGTFLANMSHEIRTPLNAIVGLTHLILRREPTAEQAQRLTQINEAADHLLSIINDILDVSKIDSGKVTLERRNIDLEALVSKVCSMVSARIDARGLALSIDLGDAPRELVGDETRLSQALLNYVSNAVKFTESGSIRVRVRQLEERNGSVVLRFEVEDSGVGISEDRLPTLFEAFRQADDSITRKYGGTGLGLAITASLARMMGGEAGASSVVGQGSCFWFSAVLQVRAGASCRAIPELREGDPDYEACVVRDFSGTRILLVEDEPINRLVAEELLTSAGLIVDVADNGYQALTRLATARYALVLMDVHMPELDGLEATRRIRRMAEFSHLPIVAMTANAFSEDRGRCLATGMNDFLAKPVEPQALFETVHRWLRQGKA